jgi:hypothetical protein
MGMYFLMVVLFIGAALVPVTRRVASRRRRAKALDPVG